MKSLALQAQVMALREIVDACAQDVVLCDDFYDVKAVLVSLKAVDGWAAFKKRFRYRFVSHQLECCGQLIKESGNVVIERRGIEVLR